MTVGRMQMRPQAVTGMSLSCRGNRFRDIAAPYIGAWYASYRSHQQFVRNVWLFVIRLRQQKSIGAKRMKNLRSAPRRVVVRWLRVERDYAALLFPILDAHERQRAASFRFEVDRQAYCASHGLLRLTLAEEFGPRIFNLRYTDSGKPKIIGADLLEELDVSLSHARGFAAVALTRYGRVGVDIEARSTDVPLEDVAPRVLSQTELEGLACVPAPLRHEKFLALWTLKEAVVKATGQGLNAELNKFTVGSDPPALLSKAPDGTDPAHWQLRSVAAEGSFIGVAAASAGEVEIEAVTMHKPDQELVLTVLKYTR